MIVFSSFIILLLEFILVVGYRNKTILFFFLFVFIFKKMKGLKIYPSTLVLSMSLKNYVGFKIMWLFIEMTNVTQVRSQIHFFILTSASLI
jgi:hypothetical protein